MKNIINHYIINLNFIDIGGIDDHQFRLSFDNDIFTMETISSYIKVIAR